MCNRSPRNNTTDFQISIQAYIHVPDGEGSVGRLFGNLVNLYGCVGALLDGVEVGTVLAHNLTKHTQRNTDLFRPVRRKNTKNVLAG